MPIYPLKLLQARERAPTPCFSVVFNLDSHLSPLRSLGVHHSSSKKHLFKKWLHNVCCIDHVAKNT
jgi:hypothetical protein